MKSTYYRIKYLITSSILSVINILGTLLIPLLIGKIIDSIYGGLPFKELLFFTIIIIFINIFSSYSSEVFMKKYVLYTINKLRIMLERNLLYAKVSEVDKQPSGTLTSKIINDINLIKEGMQQFFISFIPGVTTVILTLLIILYINKEIALYILGFTPIILLATLMLSKISKKYFKIQQSVMNELSAKTKETVELIKYIKSEKIEEHRENELKEISKRYTKASKTAIFFSSLSNPTTRFLNGVVVILVLVLSINLVEKGELTIGLLSTIVLLTSNYSKPLNDISVTLTQALNAYASYKNIKSLLKVKKEEEKELKLKLNGNIEFSNVNFKYNSEPVLKNVSFSIKEGEKVAIVGETGSGKTTIINLLLDFYSDYEGSIKLDGIDIKSIDNKDIRNQVGVLLQDSWMNSLDPQEVINYKRKSGETTNIKTTNHLTDGQKQILSIQRLDYKFKKIIILDEATSDVDVQTENELNTRINEMITGKTSIIIAHKLKTVETADKIVVLKKGEVVEIGKHEDLLKEKGEYFKIYNQI